MRLSPVLFLLFAFGLCGCDPAKLKKEAYEKGFADGQAAARASAKPAATPQQFGGTTTALGGGRPATGTAEDPQVRRVLPNSQLRGSALDQKPKK